MNNTIKSIIAEDGKLSISLAGRIDSANASDIEKSIEESINKNSSNAIVIDIDGLEYVSSAGLRIFLKYAKRFKDDFRLVNVSNDIEEIFRVTGFDQILNYDKKMRFVSIQTCEQIGRGANGCVYRLDNETIIKVFANADEDVISRERKDAQYAMIHGISTAIAYDVVKTEEGLGIVFELLNSDSLSKLFADNPDKFEFYMEKYVEMLKNVHSTEVKPAEITTLKVLYHNYADECVSWYTDDELKSIHELIDSIPDRNTIIHGDFHPGNIMLQSDELILIDMGDLGTGHPIFDLLGMASTQSNLVKLNPDFAAMLLGMPVDVINKVWRRFLELYFNVSSDADIEILDEQICLFSKLKVAFAPVVGRGAPEEIIKASVDDAKLNMLPHIEEMKNSELYRYF